MMNEETVTRAGKSRRVQVRKARKDGFIAAKRQVYLDCLAGCGIRPRREAMPPGVVSTLSTSARGDRAHAPMASANIGNIRAVRARPAPVFSGLDLCLTFPCPVAPTARPPGPFSRRGGSELRNE